MVYSPFLNNPIQFRGSQMHKAESLFGIDLTCITSLRSLNHITMPIASKKHLFVIFLANASELLEIHEEMFFSRVLLVDEKNFSGSN